MKEKILLVFLFFAGLSMYSQTFEIGDVYKVKNQNVMEVAGHTFFMMSKQNKTKKEYLYDFYKLESTGAKKVASYLVKEKRALIKLIFKGDSLTGLFSYERKKQEYFEHVTINIISGTINTVKLDIKRPNYIFGDKCFYFVNRRDSYFQFIKLNSSGEIERKLMYKIPLSIFKKINSSKLDQLVGVNTNIYNADLGAERNRIYFQDNVFNIVIKAKKKEVEIFQFPFKEGGEAAFHSVEFPDGKSTKDYNSFLMDNKFYLISERMSKVSFKFYDLKTRKLTELDLLSLEDMGVWKRDAVSRLSGAFLGKKIPSVVVHEVDSIGKNLSLVEINSIRENKVYGNNMVFDMMWQQQMQFHHQNMMNFQNRVRMNLPGGFNLKYFDSSIIDELEKFDGYKFLLDNEGRVYKTNSKIKLKLKDSQRTSKSELKAKMLSYFEKNMHKYRDCIMDCVELTNKEVMLWVYRQKENKLVFEKLAK